MNRKLLGFAAAVLVATLVGGCGSDDPMAAKAGNIASARLGQQQAFDVNRDITCKSKPHQSGSVARSYLCTGSITVSGSASPQEIALTVVCDSDRKTCIP